MSINKLYISHHEYAFDQRTLTLLDYKNLQQIINSAKVNDYHTSTADLTDKNIAMAIGSAIEVIVIDIDFSELTFSIGRLLNELTNANNITKIKFINCKMIDLLAVNKLNQLRPPTGSVMWVAGCSVTAGVGVSETERYSSILADNLNLPEILLAKGGSSILYSADQLLRSDIRSDDIVIWGLTIVPRVEVCTELDFMPVTVSGYESIDKSIQYWDLDYFSSPTQYLIHIRMILQVINFCKKIGAKLYLANILDITWLPVLFNGYDNFINLVEGINTCPAATFIDLGTDNAHPGPEQHRQYATQLFNLIKETHHGKTI